MNSRSIRRLFYFGLLLAASGSAFADFAYTIVGAGDQSCGSWLEARQSRDSVMQIGMEQWIGGYLTAWELQIKHELPRTDASAIDAWTDKYCRKNPQDKVETAAYQLALDLQRRSP